MKSAVWAVVVCILEEPNEERYEAASKTAPTAKEEMDMHGIDLLTLLSAWLHLCLFSALFCLPFHCVNPLLT